MFLIELLLIDIYIAALAPSTALSCSIIFLGGAWARCTFGYSTGPTTEPVLFEGRTDGKIVPARGPPNLGWDLS